MQKQMAAPNIALDKTTPISCEKCGHEVFKEGIILRRVSKFITATQQDQILPIPTFSCSACGHVNQEFLPAGLKSQENA